MTFRRMASGWLALAVFAAFTACGESFEDEPLPEGVEEIPVTTRSNAALAKFRKGQKYLDAGRFKEANPVFENATGKDPTFSWAYLNAALSAATVREFNDYLKLAMLYLEGKSDGERMLVEIAQTYVDNDVARRVELSQALVAAYPRSRRAWLSRAEVQAVLNEHQEARESMARALELDPDFMATHVTIWRSYLFTEPRDLARAEQAMNRCVEIDPEEGKFYEQLADVYRAMNQLEKARELYSTATEKDPGLSEASLKRGHTNSFLGNFDDARSDYDTAIERAQDQSRINYANYRAFIPLHAGDSQAALDELGLLLEDVEEIGIPRDQVPAAKEKILTARATIQLHHGLLEEAAATLEELAAVKRSIAEQADAPAFVRQREAAILLWQGRLEARKGDYDAARSQAEEHRQLLADDGNPRREESYHGLLGLIELLQGNHQQATLHLQQANPGEVYVRYLLARAHQGAGNLEEAQKLFQEVATWNFNSVGFALVRAEAMAELS